MNVWHATKSAALAIYTATVLTPLKRLYFYGPRMAGIGFWRGIPKHDICAALTNHDSHFWIKYPDACNEIIAKDFYSIEVLVETICYFALLYYCIPVVYRLIMQRYHARAGASPPNEHR